MKRDMDLIRSILLAIEECEEPDLHDAFHGIDCSDAVFHYHLGLLYREGLIDAIDGSAAGGANYMPTGLTWAGHEFLDNIRNEDVWSKAKASVHEKVGTVSLAVLQELAKSLARTALGLPG